MESTEKKCTCIFKDDPYWYFKAPEQHAKDCASRAPAVPSPAPTQDAPMMADPEQYAKIIAATPDEAWALAQKFHEIYERLAPIFGYATRTSSRKPWAEVPVVNQQLMAATCAEIAAAAPSPQQAGQVTEHIVIHPSKTADTRSCDFSKVTKETLYESSVQHIGDVVKGIDFFRGMLAEAARVHDHDKLSDIDGFHRDFVTGFAQTGWWDNHRKVNRHHLLNEDGIPADVNLIDVLDMIADCVMARMARTGTVYPLNISERVLTDAFNNTVELLKGKVIVEANRDSKDTL
jgi:hypothetical protein